MNNSINFDYIIVGGGSAGCVLANRLSALPSKRVLLCEAGPDININNLPAEIDDSYAGKAYIDPRFQWPNLMVSTESSASDISTTKPLRKYIQARVLGGGSSINGQLANRGDPDDYAQWEQRGAKGWHWDAVLPYFKKLETDIDFDDINHGQQGPITIRRTPTEHWCGHARAAAAAFKQAGYNNIADQNSDFGDGYFSVAASNHNEHRVTAATAYLNQKVRARPNLTILIDTIVTRLIFTEQCCTGVEITQHDSPLIYHANEVILSSGAIYSPAHLLRAGIGPAQELRSLGIDVLVDRPGVGKRLMDHPSIAIGTFLKPTARMNALTRRHLQVGLRYTSDKTDAKQDMFMAVMSRTAWHAVGHQLSALALMVSRTSSEQGEITLKSQNPIENPQVDFNLLADDRDVTRLMDGYHHAASLLMMPVMKEIYTDIFPASYTEQIMKYGVASNKNKILTQLGSLLLDGPPILRSYLLNTLISDEYDFNELLSNKTKLEAFVRKTAIGAFHVSCSARMGHKDDPMAVTDPAGRVYGVQGLRVVDASIFPLLPRGNANIPTMMCAEKIADEIIRSQ